MAHTATDGTTTHTIRLHRVLHAPPQRVFRAFTDAAAIAKWLPPHGFTCTVHTLDARPGGAHRMAFTNLGSGSSHGFGGTYHEVQPGERLRYSTAFAPEVGLPGEMQTTATFTPGPGGVTELHVVQEGVPAAIPATACYQGWQQSLALLALLVEADIPADA